MFTNRQTLYSITNSLPVKCDFLNKKLSMSLLLLKPEKKKKKAFFFFF